MRFAHDASMFISIWWMIAAFGYQSIINLFIRELPKMEGVVPV
jgi:hypothetical protein